MLDAPRCNQHGHAPGTVPLQTAGQFVDRRTGRHDVVDDQWVAGGKLAAYFEGTAHVALTSGCVETRLRPRGPRTNDVAGFRHCDAEAAGEFRRLIESPARMPAARQRHRDDRIAFSRDQHAHPLGKQRQVFEPMSELHGAYGCVDRKGIAKRGMDPVGRRLPVPAGAANPTAAGKRKRAATA